MKPSVGVLALQGGVSEHVRMLRMCGCSTVEVRLPADLKGISGLIIPGGESTALIRLIRRWDLEAPLRDAAGEGLPVWGTCAGSILVSTEITEREHLIEQPGLELAPVRAVRNSFGRQVASFQEDLKVKGLDESYPGVFIRAPLLVPLDPGVEVLSSVEEGAVFLRYGNIWLSSFHPELTDDARIHGLFLEGSGIGS